MSPESPLLTKSQGQIAFNERGFTLQKVSAQVMGGPAVLEGGTTATKPGQKMEVLIRAKGNFTGEGLHQETALGSISRLGPPTPMSPAGMSVDGPMWRESSVIKD